MPELLGCNFDSNLSLLMVRSPIFIKSSKANPSLVKKI
jgi:hypothetical protein